MRLEDYIPRAMSGNGTEETEQQRDKADEARIAAAFTGRITDRDGRNADRYRQVIEQRCQAVVRVAGCTWTKLKDNDPERYRRFLRGCTRAIRREAAIADGSLSGAEVAELRRRYNKQREIDRYADEFPDFIDERSEVRP